MITIRELHQLTAANPAQWEGHTVDGGHCYIRYSHGHLSAGTGVTAAEARSASAGAEPLFSAYVSADEWSESITIEDALRHMAAMVRMTVSDC
jgi:hypothetical protein